jgi:hypothetical protein
MRRKLLIAVVAAAAFFVQLVSLAESAPAARRKRRDSRKANYPICCTSAEKLESLVELNMTTAEIAAATGCSIRAIEDRRRRLSERSATHRRSKADDRIDAFYSLTSMLRMRYKIPPENVRAFFICRSGYLGEQRPAILLGSGEFELVREAAIAYATSETPDEFLERVGPVARVLDPLGA